MPWEKSFDEEKAIEKAMTLFWEKGYEETSISDLIETTGINRGSLYNAFGGKRELFTQSLLKYDAINRRAILAELESMDDPVKAIHYFFDAVIKETVEDKEKKGCFLVNTTLELPQHDDKTKSIVAKWLNELEAFFRRCIEVGQARKEIPKTLDPKVTSKELLALVVAIRVLGRGAYDKAALTVIANQGKQAIL